jgi:hypothetical protein
MNQSASHVRLPGGYWKEGALLSDVWVRPLSGEIELSAAEPGSAIPAKRVTELLASCIVRLGDLRDPGTEAAAVLTVGDREALLLHIRRLAYGEKMKCVLTCPWPECGEHMDLDLSIRELLVPPYENFRPAFETEISVPTGRCRVEFRLPTGADQEASAALATRDPKAAARMILNRCLSSVKLDDAVVDRLPDEAVEALAQAMNELDPQAELRLNPVCPACGRGFSTILDTARFLFEEIAARGRAILREVDLLAARYHWSESAILAMTSSRRRSYCALLYEGAQPGVTR